MKHIALSTGPERVAVLTMCPRVLEEMRNLLPVVANKNVYQFHSHFEHVSMWCIKARPHKLRQIFNGIQPFQSAAEILDMDGFYANLKEALPDSEKPPSGIHPDWHVSVAPRTTLSLYRPRWMGGELLLSDGFCPVRVEEHGNYIKGVPANEFLRALFPDP